MAASRVHVFNQALLEDLVIDDNRHHTAGSTSIDGGRGGGGSQFQASRMEESHHASTSPLKQRRQQQMQHLHELEAIRQRRYDRNRMEAATKAAEADRKVLICLISHFYWGLLVIL
jgi:hypothetical protein